MKPFLLRLRRWPLLLSSIIMLILVGLLNLGHNDKPAEATKTVAHVSSNPSLDKEITTLASPVLALPKNTTSKPSIFAKSYILSDSTTKYPLLAKNPDMPVPIASTTKIMTALVAMDTLDLDQVVTITPEAATINGSEIYLMTGEKLTVRSLLYALLINSANDAAYALSQAKGPTEDFVIAMNAKAQALGLHNTVYKDPAGLDDTGTSTARDLANLTHYMLGHSLFRSIVSTPMYTIWSADSRYKHDLKNSNRLVVPDEPLFLSQAIGVKTGFTYAAGHCLIAAVHDHNKDYVAVVLNTNEDSKDASAKEARKLLTWALQD
jgi:D-alanyl-D-alanine carboxypeptidase (penicillin-binding protein 5/6)